MDRHSSPVQYWNNKREWNDEVEARFWFRKRGFNCRVISPKSQFAARSWFPVGFFSFSFLPSFFCLFVCFFFVLCESFPCYGILGDWKFCFSFFAKKRFCLSGYLCNFTIRFWMYAEATCEIPRRVTRQRGTQIIYVFFQIDPNVYELLLEIGHCVRLCQPRHKWVFCKNSSRQSSIELSCDQI